MEKPDLPTDTDWPEATVEWFNSWKDSNRTDNWDASQWQYMFDTAIVHSLIYEAEQFQLLGELRTRLAYMGLTFEPAPKQVEVRLTPFDEIAEQYRSGHDRREPDTTI